MRNLRLWLARMICPDGWNVSPNATITLTNTINSGGDCGLYVIRPD